MIIIYFFNQYVINKICNSKGVSNLKYNNNNYYFLSHHIRLYLIIEGKDDLADMFKMLGVRPRLNSPGSFRNWMASYCQDNNIQMTNSEVLCFAERWIKY